MLCYKKDTSYYIHVDNYIAWEMGILNKNFQILEHLGRKQKWLLLTYKSIL